MANEKRLIDANALYNWLWETVDDYHWGTRQYTADDVCNMLEDAPTVDAVEVVHGRWVFGTANHREYMKCSVCLKSQTPTGVFTYCPNCGAKMDGGNEDG